MSVQVLGSPPGTLAHRVEPLFVFLEEQPGGGTFAPVSWAGGRIEVHQGSMDTLPTALIGVNLARNPESHGSFTGFLYDWQVLGPGNYGRNIEDVALGGRRIQVRTARPSPSTDWPLFEGFVTRVEPGWNGQSPTRWATIVAESTVVAADRELSQKHFGQWRRHYDAEVALQDFDPSSLTTRECCRIAQPAVFKPGGKVNCRKIPLKFGIGGDENVYVFGDTGAEQSEWWTVARMLRYIQWASFQPAPSVERNQFGYDQPYLSIADRGPFTLAASGITSFRIGYENLTGNGDKLLGNRVNLQANGGTASIPDQVLLRALPDVSIDGMSTLEALAYVCDRAGILVWYDHYMSGGQLMTRIRFSIRGDRKRLGSGSGGGGFPGSPGYDPWGLPNVDPGEGTSRGLYLLVPTDRYDESSRTVQQLMAAMNAAGGQIAADESGVRTGIYEIGDAGQFEGVWSLNPGWEPNADWDVDTGDAQKVSDAQRKTREDATWKARYVLDAQEGANLRYSRVGRYWVLNEDGAFTATKFKRQYDSAPWSDEGDWNPYPFHVTVQELERRAGKGWSVRARKFLPTIALLKGAAADPDKYEVGAFVQVSCDSGATWLKYSRPVQIEQDRCAVYLRDSDLRSFVDPVTQKTLPEVYIAGKLRVRVVANIEGDDLLREFARPDEGKSLIGLPWYELLDRRDTLRRILRDKANSVLPGLGVLFPGNLDHTFEARNHALRMQAELEMRRFAGQVTIPWLARDGGASWQGFRIGGNTSPVCRIF